MMTSALIGLILAAALPFYAYAAYPVLVRMLAAFRPRPRRPGIPDEWPAISIVLCAFNEEKEIRGTIEALLMLDYPPEKRQIVIVSDGSTDRTDEIVAGYADRGIELVRMPRRSGKTSAENATLSHVRGEIVVNTDASVRIHPDALKELIPYFADPGVGLVSGRDISVNKQRQYGNAAEADYVGYEMRLRDFETRAGGIIGASGSLYAIRAELHRIPIPDHLSRDFMAVLNARERGFRGLSASDALCYVPRTGSLRAEHRRKIRTILRGMQTLAYKRHLLNPLRYGLFSWMLFSHKICRWCAAWCVPLAAAALAMLAAGTSWAGWALAALGISFSFAVLAWFWPREIRIPRVLTIAAYALFGNLAACRAAVRALAGRGAAVWEPTRRATAPRGSST